MQYHHPEKCHLGFGLGLRPEYYEEILAEKPSVDWFEILTENYLVPGGKPLYYLDKIRDQYPLVMHGVSLSIGSCDPLDWHYLHEVKMLALRIEPKWISDHLCFTGIHQKNTHDLLPLPYTEEAIIHVVDRIKQVQDYLDQRILIENVSSYVNFASSEMSEAEFLSEIAQRADCLILLDINNIYVSATNHAFDAENYLAMIPSNRVGQIHLAGHSNEGDYLIDTHDHPIIDPVWDLYAKTVEKCGPVATMIERDDHFPPLADLLSELSYAKNIAEMILKKVNVA